MRVTLVTGSCGVGTPLSSVQYCCSYAEEGGRLSSEDVNCTDSAGLSLQQLFLPRGFLCSSAFALFPHVWPGLFINETESDLHKGFPN